MLNKNTSSKFYSEEFCVENAKSNRSACKECNKVINEGDLRIGHSIVFDQHGEFVNKQWYHLGCVKLPSRHSDLILEDIQGSEELPLSERNLIKKKLRVKDIADGGVLKPKRKIKPMIYFERVDLDKVKGRDVKIFDANGFTKFKKLANELASNKTANELKEILSKNCQRTSGDKNKLAVRVAQIKMLGTIPNCPNCGGLNLKFDIQKNVFYCPGYLDDVDWVSCGRVFSPSEITRGKFEE